MKTRLLIVPLLALAAVLYLVAETAPVVTPIANLHPLVGEDPAQWSAKQTESLARLAAGTPAVSNATVVVWRDVSLTNAGALKAFSTNSVYARMMIITAATANAQDVAFGPSSNVLMTLGPGLSFKVPDVAGGVFALDGWVWNSANNDVLHVLYLQ